MIRKTVVLIWIYLVLLFIVQTYTRYEDLVLTERVGELEGSLYKLKQDNIDLEQQLAEYTSLEYARQKAKEWGFDHEADHIVIN